MNLISIWRYVTELKKKKTGKKFKHYHYPYGACSGKLHTKCEEHEHQKLTRILAPILTKV